MQRPSSIVSFDRLYLGSLALYLLNGILFWSATREIMLGSPQVAATPAVASMVPAIMIGSLAVTAAVSLLFWWLVSRARSVVGKWLVVVTEAIGAVVGLLALLRVLRGTSVNTPSVLLGLAATVLAVAAAAMLFRADATAWFATQDAEPVA